MPRRSFISPEFKRLFGRVILALAVLELLFQIFVWFPDNWQRADRTRDLVVYFDAAQRLKNGISPYQPWPEFNPSLLPSRFFYPPPFLLLTKPLDGLSYVWFGRVWTLLLLAAFWIYAVALSKLATGKVTWRGVLISKLCIDLCPCGYAALGLGNFEPVMWACYGIALSTSYRAAPLAFAAMTKLHPVWVLMMVVKREGWRAFVTAAVVLAVGLTLGILTCGWQNSLQWWPATSPVVSQGTFSEANVSLSFILVRILHFLGLIRIDVPLPGAVKLYLSVMAVGMPWLTMYLSRRLPQELRYGLVASATILFSPLCWTAYIPLLLAPAAIWWRWRSQVDQITFTDSKPASSVLREEPVAA